MHRSQIFPALALSALLALPACDGASEEHQPDDKETSVINTPAAQADSMAAGENVQTVPPPVGTIEAPVPPDTNSSLSTPGASGTQSPATQSPAGAAGSPDTSASAPGRNTAP